MHKYLRGWTTQDFLERGRTIGPNTEQVIERLLGGKTFPEQSFDACLGVLRLGNGVGSARLEAACGLALQVPKVRYSLVKTILENNRDKAVQADEEHASGVPEHENIRGKLAYT